jgi:2-alkyl-3-oxoalkanoate reductase
MKLLITGASGFIGRRLVHTAIAAGHQVVALVRRDVPDLPCDKLHCDLSKGVPENLAHQGIDVVIHLAAALSGPAELQKQVTVMGTRNLLDAMATAGIGRLVGVSSLAVIDYRRIDAGTLVKEDAPTVQPAPGVSAYAQGKAEQETLFFQFGATPSHCVTVLRPGLVYDAGVLNAAYAGLHIGPLHLDARHGGQIPVTHCNALAQCLLHAAQGSSPGCRLYHVLDDPLPDQQAYLGELRRRGRSSSGISVDWRLFRAAASVGQMAARVLPVPEILTTQGFATRLKPMRYSTARACEELGCAPSPAFGTVGQEGA